MAATDRILPICDLLLGAAYADGRFESSERETVRELLSDLAGGALPPEVAARIESFDPKSFDLAAVAAQFVRDPVDDRKRLLYLVAAIHEADDELDLAEDQFLTDLAAALQLPPGATDGMTLSVEEEVLQDNFTKVRKGPPPPPGAKKDGSVDVDVD
jgi:uncharacterized tellurite resistance protein B-like protein